MKRIVALVLVLVLFVPVAFASGIIDFSSYTTGMRLAKLLCSLTSLVSSSSLQSVTTWAV